MSKRRYQAQAIGPSPLLERRLKGMDSPDVQPSAPPASPLTTQDAGIQEFNLEGLPYTDLEWMSKGPHLIVMNEWSFKYGFDERIGKPIFIVQRQNRNKNNIEGVPEYSRALIFKEDAKDLAGLVNDWIQELSIKDGNDSITSLIVDGGDLKYSEPRFWTCEAVKSTSSGNLKLRAEVTSFALRFHFWSVVNDETIIADKNGWDGVKWSFLSGQLKIFHHAIKEFNLWCDNMGWKK